MARSVSAETLAPQLIATTDAPGDDPIVDECGRAGVGVFVDPKSPHWGRYAGATCVTPNRKELHEAGHAAGIMAEDVATIARELKEMHSLEHGP